MAESRVKAVKNKADISAGKLAERAKDLMSAGVLIDARARRSPDSRNAADAFGPQWADLGLHRP